MKALRSISIGLFGWLVLSSALQSVAQTNLLNVTNIPMAATAFSVCLRGHYLYSGGGGNGLRIFDISDLSNPLDVGYVDPLGASTAVILSGQSIYRLSGIGYSGSITILTLQNPTNPTPVANIDGNFIQMKAARSRLYLNGSIGTDSGLLLYDVTDPANPARVALFTNYNPSTTVEGQYAATVSYPIGWLVYSTNFNERDTVAVPLTEYNVLKDAIVEGDFVYGSGVSNTLTIHNVSDPSRPTLVYGPRFGDCNNFSVSGNYLYAVGDSFFTVWDISNPTNAFLVNFPLMPYSWGVGLAVTNGYAYVANGYGLSVYSLGRPSPPPLTIISAGGQLLCSWPTPNPAFALQENPDLSSNSWLTLTNRPTVIGSQNQVRISEPEQSMFYRLVSQ